MSMYVHACASTSLESGLNRVKWNHGKQVIRAMNMIRYIVYMCDIIYMCNIVYMCDIVYMCNIIYTWDIAFM